MYEVYVTMHHFGDTSEYVIGYTFAQGHAQAMARLNDQWMIRQVTVQYVVKHVRRIVKARAKEIRQALNRKCLSLNPNT